MLRLTGAPSKITTLARRVLGMELDDCDAVLWRECSPVPESERNVLVTHLMAANNLYQHGRGCGRFKCGQVVAFFGSRGTRDADDAGEVVELGLAG